jgi:hypothetical protein
MKKIVTRAGACATLLLAAAAYAQPANDLCSNAAAVNNGPNAFNNTGALDDTTASCAFNAIDVGDVWFSYLATNTGAYNLTTDGTTGISDTVLSVYASCGGTELACDDDSGAGLLSTITGFNMTAGTTYIIRVAAWGNATTQFGPGNLTITPPGGGGGAPANDLCSAATAINAAGTYAWDNTGADADGTATCTTSGPSVWFRYNPIGTGLATFNTEGSAGLTDTVLSLFDACNGTELACDDDAGTGFLSSISYNVTLGTPIWIRCSGFAGAVGGAQLNVIQVLCPSPVANDTCATPAPAVLGSNTWDNSCSSVDGAPASCAFNVTDGKDVWFDFTPAASGTFRIDTNGSTIVDTTLAVYASCGAAEVACDDDAGTGLQSQVTTLLNAGTTYKIRVAAWGVAPASGAGVLNIQSVVLQPGDVCATALPAALGANNFDNTGYSSDSAAASCAFAGIDGADIWFSFTPAVSGSYLLDTNASSVLTDTTLTVFDVCGGAEIACDDDSGTGLLSQAVASLTGGTNYRIRVAGWGDPADEGAGTLTIALAVAPTNDTCATPQVVTLGDTPFNNVAAGSDGASATCAAGGTDGADLFFSYSQPTNGFINVNTNASVGIADTTLAIYDVGCGTQLACSDDDGTGLLSQIDGFAVTANTNYIIRVAGWGAVPARGDGVLTIAGGVAPPPGDSCTTALIAGVGSNPFDNTGATNDGLTVCVPTTADIWFVYVPQANGLATIDTFGSGIDTVVAAFSACGGTLLACNDDFNATPQSQIGVPVSNGVPIFIRVASFTGFPTGAGTLNINLGPCVNYTPLAGSAEGEACVDGGTDTVNGGCNATPNVYGSINCGDVINGTTWWNGTTRDTDWYRFTVASTSNVRIQSQAQFPAALFLLQDGAACTGIVALGNDTNNPPCADMEILATVPAGTYRIFMGPQFIAGQNVVCGTNDSYWLTLAVTDSASCDRDFNNDCLFPDSGDLDDFIAVLSGGPNACSTGPGRCDSVDFNRDTIFPDSQDLDDFITALGGSCPP